MSFHVLITGATGGVGQGLALEYAAPGTVLTLTGRDEDRLFDLAVRCRKKGAEVRTCILDIRKSDEVSKWVLSIDNESPVDLVFANAGVSSANRPDGSLEPYEDVQRLFEVNTLGVVATVHPLAERMRKRGHGQICIVGSLSGLRPFPDTPTYTASKGGARLYGKSLRASLAECGVKVSVVTMGFVETPMSDRYVGDHPFKCSPMEAARKIRNGLDRNQGEITFPWILGLGIKCLGIFIEPVANWILNKFFKCSVLPDKDSPLSRD